MEASSRGSPSCCEDDGLVCLLLSEAVSEAPSCETVKIEGDLLVSANRGGDRS